MRFVFVLEDEAKLQQEICEAILNVDPKTQIRIFANLAAFVAWIKVLMAKGPSAIAEAGVAPENFPQEAVNPNEEHQVRVLISKVEFLGADQLNLLQRVLDLFIKTKLCTKEDPTSFVFTAFDDLNFKVSQFEKSIVSNVIFKPFDRLILTQHLTYAIEGHRKPSKQIMADQKTSAVVEIVKDIQMEALSEVGFITRSDTQLRPGKIAKYYGPSFTTDTKRSVLARMTKCEIAAENKYDCHFSFFAADNAQIANIRKVVRHKDATVIPPKSKPKSFMPDDKDLDFVIIHESRKVHDTIIETVANRFPGIKFHSYSSLLEFLIDLDPKSFQQQEGAAPPKAFNNPDLEFVFDNYGQTIFSFEGKDKSPGEVFGLPASDMINKSNWFPNALAAECREPWRRWVAKPEEGVVFKVRSKDNFFYIKPMAFTKSTKKLNVKFVELTPEERTQYLLKNSRMPRTVDAILVNQYFVFGFEEKWNKILEIMQVRSASQKQTLIFSLNHKTFSEKEELEVGKYVNDVFYEPLERTYFLQKILVHFPDLRSTNDPVTITTIEKKETIRAATPVQVTEISEAGLMMQYHRAMEPGAFRDFILYNPLEHKAPEHRAICNVSEESAEKGVFNCHFIFFGVRDAFLKSVRIWIKDIYILSKEKG